MQIQEDVTTPASEICIRAVVSVHRLRALDTLIGQLHLISVPSPPPPVEDLPFLLTPEDWLKLHSPLKTSIKYGFTPEELGHTPEEYGFTPEEFCEN